MPILPEPIIERDDINLRLDIKSSIPKMKEFLGTYFTFYFISNEKDSLEYSIANANKIVIKSELLEKLNDFFSEQLAQSNIISIEDKINESPFFDIQIEPLQVGLEFNIVLAIDPLH